jgi:uncharacterized protein (DUF2141 family)
MKRKLLMTATMMALVFAGFAQVRLEVTVTGIKENKGSIRVGLFNSEDDFLKKAVYGEIVKVTGSEVVVVFNHLPEGEYGVSVVHDENENGELDSNFMGIPKEGFGFGNDAMGAFGPPSYRDAKIKVDATHLKQKIRIRYL